MVRESASASARELLRYACEIYLYGRLVTQEKKKLEKQKQFEAALAEMGEPSIEVRSDKSYMGCFLESTACATCWSPNPNVLREEEVSRSQGGCSEGGLDGCRALKPWIAATP